MSRKIITVMESADLEKVHRIDFGNVAVYPKRAASILEKIYTDATCNQGFFAHINREMNAPQNTIFPEGVRKGDPLHMLWLFFAVMTDRRGQSFRVYEGHVRLWEKYRWLYTSEVAQADAKDVVDIVRREGLGLHSNIIENWVRVAKTLFDVLDGNPLNIYESGSINSIVYPMKGDRRLDLPGFGPKILSLLSMFYKEMKYMKIMPLDAFPVDVHVQRIAISTGILESSDGMIPNNYAEAILRFLICSLANRKDWSRVELSNALWLIGNRGCSGCYRRAIMSHFCPVYDECNGAIDSGPYYKGKWNLEKMFRKSCGYGEMFSPDLPLMRFASDD
jgi:endonuclease III